MNTNPKKDYFKATPVSSAFLSAAGGEDDDRGRVYVRCLLAALSYLLLTAPVLPRFIRTALHPTGLPGHHVAGHELYHVQPNHLLLPQQQVRSLVLMCPS